MTLNRIRCRDCEWLADYSARYAEQFGIRKYFCLSKKTVHWDPIDGWSRETKDKDPLVLNKDGDCPHFKRK